MIETLRDIDLVLFRVIHTGTQNSLFDVLMPLLRIPYVWAPVYLFLLAWMWQRYRFKGLAWCAFFFITFVFCDYISAGIIKKAVMRIRPCNDEALSHLVRHLVPCGKGYSFPSAHASNHFGLSFFMIFTLGSRVRYLAWIALTWALLVSFAQVYVGVHYPFDIAGGALLGLIIAWLMHQYFMRRVHLV